MITYVQALSAGFPAVEFSAINDGSVYTDITWVGGAAMPSQATLDEWIVANPDGVAKIEITKYEFRKLFTLAERIAIDSAPSNTAIPANYRAMLITMNKDMELSQSVFLTNPDVAAGVGFLETLGLIAPGRAAEVLSNTPPE
jgi:hypothetical protein